METSTMFSPEEMQLLDGLWDDDDEDSYVCRSATPETSVSSAAAQLEEKLLSIEKGADVTPEVLGHIKNVNTADIDAILAKEMAALSVQERDYVIQDIHGIAEEEFPEDDNNFLQQQLQQLEVCLTQIDPKSAYNRALYQAPDYVRNDQFRLLFLRGERFNVQAAAQLMVLHFEEKQRLFGTDVLGRDIRLDDLSDVDRKELEKGFLQILPVRDRAGRIVVCILGGPLDEATSTNRVGFKCFVPEVNRPWEPLVSL
jgi:hypothetical protein